MHYLFLKHKKIIFFILQRILTNTYYWFDCGRHCASKWFILPRWENINDKRMLNITLFSVLVVVCKEEAFKKYFFLFQECRIAPLFKPLGLMNLLEIRHDFLETFNSMVFLLLSLTQISRQVYFITHSYVDTGLTFILF